MRGMARQPLLKEEGKLAVQRIVVTQVRTGVQDLVSSGYMITPSRAIFS